MEKKRITTRYLISRHGEPRYTGLTKEELDILLKEGSVKCADTIIEAKDGDEILKIEMVEKFEVNREGDTCYLRPTEEQG